MENTNKDLINRFLFASDPLVSSFKEISHCMHFLSFAWIFIQMPHCGTWERASKRSDVACERATLPANVLTLPANVRRCLRTCDVACERATLPANMRRCLRTFWRCLRTRGRCLGTWPANFDFCLESSFKCRTVRSLETLRNFQLDYFRVTVVGISIPMIYARNGLAANSLELIIDASFTRRTLTMVPKGSIHFHSFANTIIVR